MPNEVELKFPLRTHAGVRGALANLGAVRQGSVVQSDCYFDTADGRLRKADCGLRLRTVLAVRGRPRGPADRPQLTYKGRRNPTSKAKIRPEYQTHVEDPRVIGQILGFLGLFPAIIIEKRRTSYRLGRCLVELDEVPLIGRFVEIEGPSESAVLRAARRLKLTGEPIQTSYTALVAQAVGECATRPVRIRLRKSKK